MTVPGTEPPVTGTKQFTAVHGRQAGMFECTQVMVKGNPLVYVKGFLQISSRGSKCLVVVFYFGG